MHQNFYKLLNQLSKPSKVASTLDWKKMSGSTLLSLNIHRNRIGIAVASHPSLGIHCQELEPLRFADDHITIDKDCLERFQSVIEDYQVCGIVVSWPLQHDTGRMGAACGRVLYALEEILDKTGGIESNVMSSSRPLCLWDSGHIIHKTKTNPKLNVDSFGRCAQYGNTSSKEEHRASREQYHEDELTVVQQVWNDFCKEHWPDLYQQSVQGGETTSSRTETSPNNNTAVSAYANNNNKPRRSLVQMAR